MSTDPVPGLQTRSWWLEQALEEDGRAPQLTSATTADVCIVGGGFTGLWTALRIKEVAPATDVVIVEADCCGGGASGRNGGFAMSFWHHFVGLEQLCGREGAVRLALASVDAVSSIGSFCEAHGIDAEFHQGGWLWTATNEAQRNAWASTVDAIARCGHEPFRALRAEEVASRTGSAQHLAGVFEAGPATLQPAKLARGLRGVALDMGVRIFERTPMVELDRGTVLEVRTPAGQVRARSVVIAMNAWAARLRELRNAIVAMGSDIVLTPPSPDTLDEIGIPEGLSISDSRLMVHYYRRAAGGRLAFGKGGSVLAFRNRVGAKFDGPSRRTAWVTEGMYRLYPQLRSLGLAASWSGPIDRAFDGLPFFSRLGRPDLVCGLGFSGNGVGPSVIGGRILASLALGIEDEWSQSGLVREPPRRLPPEPARYLGGNLVRAAVARKERAEDEGRRGSALDRGLTRLAPTGLVPTD